MIYNTPYLHLSAALSVLFLVILISDKKKRGYVNKNYIRLLLVGIAYAVLNLIDNASKTLIAPNRAIIWLCEQAGYCCFPLIRFFFLSYVLDELERNNDLERRIIKYYVFVWYVIWITNPLTGLIFTVTKDCVVVRGPLQWTMTTFPAFMSLYGFGLLFFTKGRYALRHRILYLVLFMISSVTYIIQFFEEDLMISSIAVPLIAFVCYLCFESPDKVKLRAAVRKLEISQANEEESRALAEKANKAKSQFLSNMSHEIRTPLNVILGLDEIILRESTKEETVDYAMKMKMAGKTLLGTINDILDFSKIESGKLELIMREYDLAETIVSLMDLEKVRAEKKGLKLVVDVDKKIPRYYFGDDVRLRQILTNLLTNAVKYTQAGTVTFSVSGTMEGEEALLTFSVQDTGIGIKEEDIGKLYEEFERIDEKRNKSIEGTGLGLSITLSLLELMGSKLEVQSAYGVGSKFFFTIKQEIVDKQPIEDSVYSIKDKVISYKYEPSISIPEANVLVVDDKELNIFVMEKLLGALNAKTDRALGGNECVELAKNKHYDLIFLDHMMPMPDGIETLHMLKKEPMCEGTKIIVMTANAMVGVEENYLSEGFDAYISKPIEPNVLEKVICKVTPRKLIEAPIRNDGLVDVNITKEEKATWESIIATGEFEHAKAMEYSSNIRDYLEIVKRFLLSLGGDIEKISKLLEADDIKENLDELRIQAHSLKSSARLCGLSDLAVVSASTEAAARINDISGVQKEGKALIKEAMRILDIMQEVCLRVDSEKRIAFSKDAFLALIGIIRSSITENDIDMLDKCAEKMLTFILPHKLEGKVLELTSAINILDYDKIEAKLSELDELIKEVEA